LPVPTPYNEVTIHQRFSCTEQTDLSPAGRVFVHGEIWKAEADQTVRRGERLKVVEVAKTLKIKVTRA
jgi:membrane-bound serine protease (ClpP class)